MNTPDNPLHYPGSPTPDRVRALTGLRYWPKGLRWHVAADHKGRAVASYTIASKGRNGARARQLLMTHKKFELPLTQGAS